jgi:hypothetical protein
LDFVTADCEFASNERLQDPARQIAFRLDSTVENLSALWDNVSRPTQYRSA